MSTLKSGEYSAIELVKSTEAVNIWNALALPERTPVTVVQMELAATLRMNWDLYLESLQKCTEVIHPSILKMRSATLDTEREVIVFENDRSLAPTLKNLISQRRKEDRPFTEEEIWTILAQVSSGLQAIHSVLSTTPHRVLNPEHVYVEYHEDTVPSVQVGALGYSILGFSNPHRSPYIPPEEFMQNTVHQLGDVWALGCLALEMCTFEAPTFLVETDILSSALATSSSRSPLYAKPAIGSPTAQKRSAAQNKVEEKIRGLMKSRGYAKTLVEIIVRCLQLRFQTRCSLSWIMRSPQINSALREYTCRTRSDSLAYVHSLLFTEGNAAIASDKLDAEDIMLLDLMGLLSSVLNWCHDNNCLSSCTMIMQYLSQNGSAARLPALASHTTTKPTPLMEAVLQGNVDAVRENLQYLMYVYMGDSALLLAAEHGRTDCIPMLLMESCLAFPDTALIRAATHGHVDCVKLLTYEARAQVISTDETAGWTALMFAVRNGHADCVQILAPLETKIRSVLGKCALDIALTYMRPSLVRYLTQEIILCEGTHLMLAAGEGDLDELEKHMSECGKEDKHGWTALSYAIVCDQPYCMAKLMDNEGELRGLQGASPIEFAAESAAWSCVEYITRDTLEGLPDAPSDVVEQAKLLLDQAYRDNMWRLMSSICMYLNHMGVYVQVKPLPGKETSSTTPLMRAARDGNLIDARVSLRFAGQIKSSILDNGTALMHAAEGGHLSIVRLLLGEMGIVGKYGGSALMRAAENGHVDCVRLLLPEVHIRSADGWTPLMAAAWYNRPAVIPLLSALQGCATDASFILGELKGAGWTALMAAAYKGHVECVRLLLQEVRMQNAEGWTALMLAAQKEHHECVKLLIFEGGMQLNNVGSKYCGWTALMMAAQSGSSEIVRLLAPKELRMCTSDGLGALQVAINNHNYNLVRLLGDEISTMNGTELMIAAATNDVAQLSTLLETAEGKALAGQKDRNGWYALTYATVLNFRGVVERLLAVEAEAQHAQVILAQQRGRDLSEAQAVLTDFIIRHPLSQRELYFGGRTINRKTRLMYCAEHTDLKGIRESLGEAGLIYDDNTALMLATVGEKVEAIPYLLLEAEITDSEGHTALSKAVLKGRTRIVDYLLRSGVFKEDACQAALRFANDYFSSSTNEAERDLLEDCIRMLEDHNRTEKPPKDCGDGGRSGAEAA
ncbi:Kinase, NEK [Giardia muris]|uniref:Kinase, NEK n=1 Tax=Giardia muris TaxID=5742 RepID=A0A4Z1SU66_GIAMU|nr:Kinase, NEK [Giardia muris]|eukprot:TNJ28515.1 Kinase, NEK [Giardia muris]